MATTRRAVTAAALVAVIGGLAACAPALTRDQRDAREKVVTFMRTTAMQSYHPEMADVARAAAGSGPRLVGWTDERSGDRIGTLTFAVTAPEAPDVGGFQQKRQVDPGPYCFRVDMGTYGKLGEFGTADGIRLVDCPDPLVDVTPPPSDDPVVAPNAREAAWQVLTDLPLGEPADVDDVAAWITGLLDPPVEEGRTLTEVKVTVRGADVGVATGGPDDCVLVARIDGTVTDVHVAPVQLQPGEAGCTAGTALAGLRPPH